MPIHDTWNSNTALAAAAAAPVIDEGKRQVLEIEVAHSILSLLVIRVMEQLIELHGEPMVPRLHNGPELTSLAFTEWCAGRGIEARFIQTGETGSERVH
jgi:putative transposase